MVHILSVGGTQDNQEGLVELITGGRQHWAAAAAVGSEYSFQQQMLRGAVRASAMHRVLVHTSAASCTVSHSSSGSCKSSAAAAGVPTAAPSTSVSQR